MPRMPVNKIYASEARLKRGLAKSQKVSLEERKIVQAKGQTAEEKVVAQKRLLQLIKTAKGDASVLLKLGLNAKALKRLGITAYDLVINGFEEFDLQTLGFGRQEIFAAEATQLGDVYKRVRKDHL